MIGTEGITQSHAVIWFSRYLSNTRYLAFKKKNKRKVLKNAQKEAVSGIFSNRSAKHYILNTYYMKIYEYKI